MKALRPPGLRSRTTMPEGSSNIPPRRALMSPMLEMRSASAFFTTLREAWVVAMRSSWGSGYLDC